jgi:hypothetical protein
MNLDQYRKATPIITAMDQVSKAIIQAKSLVSYCKANENKANELPGVWGMQLGIPRDQSGEYVDLNGCYVGLEVAEATLKVLEVKLMELEKKIFKEI